MPLKNRRVDPRTPDTVEWGEQITDGKTVAEFAELPARYGIRTTQIFNPDAVSCEIADDEYSTFSTLTRIYSGNPSASEYYADGGSAYIFLHASNVGKYARALIYPGGSVLTAEVLNSDEFKGPTGATGPQGPQGPTGPAGGVTTIFGRSGTVTAQTGDYNLDQISDGTTNKAFTATEKTKLAGIAAGADVSPVLTGFIMPFGGTSAPTGWLACDGSSVLRASYPALFSAIGTTHGAADGTHFNVPDMRGLFVRGAGAHGSMTKAAGGAFDGGSVGATDNDALQGHKHDMVNGSGATGGAVPYGAFAGVNNYETISTIAKNVQSSISDGSNGTPRTGNETKPASISLLYCIKT